MNRFTVFLIYNLLLPVVLIIGFPRFVWKGIQRGGLARNFGQRFGCYGRKTRERLKSHDGAVWIHAVSVGEVLVAMKVIAALARESPEKPVVLSTTTTTGFAVAEKEARDNVTVIHNPVDLPLVVGRAIRLIRPERLVLVEAEVWPNLVRKVRARGISVTLVNARLSGRSERRFRKFATLTKPIFAMLDQVCVPFEKDIRRWESLGVSRERIELTGSVKFDEEGNANAMPPREKVEELDGWLQENGFDAGNGPLLLAASTHAGEEALIGRAWLALREEFPGLQYIAVPRHAERARELGRELANAGIGAVFRQPLGETLRPGEIDRPCCAVSNTTGELRAWYVLADIVVVGKSFLSRGGQNPVEPVSLGCPTVVGPQMQNFRSVVADLVRAEGILQLSGDRDDSADVHLPRLVEAIRTLLRDEALAEGMAERGGEALQGHQGAAQRTAKALLAAEVRRIELG